MTERDEAIRALNVVSRNLRESAKDFERHGGFDYPVSAYERIRHGADEIDRLEAGNAELRESVSYEQRINSSLRAENARLNQWVSDLQSGMYVNCVYCGHRYGPGETTPVSMADALKAHVERCPKHPMSALKDEVERLKNTVSMLETDRINLAGNLEHMIAEVERLRATYEAPPTPLTAEDLAQMEGEPVYVRYGDGKEGWDHVEDGMPIWLEADPDFINMICSFDKDGHFGLHVLGWQAFRRRPEAARAALGREDASDA